MQAERLGLEGQAAPSHAEVVLVDGVGAAVVGKGLLGAGQDEDPGILGPALIGFDQTGEGLLPGFGVSAVGDDIAPRLLVKAGGSPAGGFQAG
jgi:hypothetical protein